MSTDAALTEGAAFPWVLEHLLAYPGTYEIPLRTMYTLNAATQTQQLQAKPNQTPGNAFPARPSTAGDGQVLSTYTAAAQLRANLVSHISQQPSQPASLPPSFVTSFVRRVFSPTLESVDFPQALTALDYLKDLEVRRRREVVAALGRLGIDKNDFAEKDKLGKKYPRVLKWIMDIEEKERTVEALYTQVYLGLRRWTLINEMSLRPFNKSNCIAMLNTLYPPINSVQPTAQLTNQVLLSQRDQFFRYILAVEKSGPVVLKALMEQGRSRDHRTAWPNLRETVDRYLREANSIIDECYEIMGKESLSPVSGQGEAESQRSRKVDSGVGFTAPKPQTANRSSTSTLGSNKSKEHSDSSEKSAGSTMERIAREIRRIKSRNDMGESARSGRREKTRGSSREENVLVMEDGGLTPKTSRLRLRPSLKKMRSVSALGERDRNLNSAGSVGAGNGERDGIPEFDVEEMKRRKLQWETQAMHKTNSSIGSMASAV